MKELKLNIMDKEVSFDLETQLKFVKTDYDYDYINDKPYEFLYILISDDYITLPELHVFTGTFGPLLLNTRKCILDDDICDITSKLICNKLNKLIRDEYNKGLNDEIL